MGMFRSASGIAANGCIAARSLSRILLVAKGEPSTCPYGAAHLALNRTLLSATSSDMPARQPDECWSMCGDGLWGLAAERTPVPSPHSGAGYTKGDAATVPRGATRRNRPGTT